MKVLVVSGVAGLVGLDVGSDVLGSVSFCAAASFVPFRSLPSEGGFDKYMFFSTNAVYGFKRYTVPIEFDTSALSYQLILARVSVSRSQCHLTEMTEGLSGRRHDNPGPDISTDNDVGRPACQKSDLVTLTSSNPHPVSRNLILYYLNLVRINARY